MPNANDQKVGKKRENNEEKSKDKLRNKKCK